MCSFPRNRSADPTGPILPVTRRTLVGSLAAGLSLAALPYRPAGAQSGENARAIYARLRDPTAILLPLTRGRIRLVFADGAPGVDRAAVIGWIKRAAAAVTTYFGRYPVAEHGLVVFAQDEAKVGHATTWGFAGPITRIFVGRDTPPAAFARDWVLVHEMLHTALPDLPEDSTWLLEGNATWVEPIARVMAGQLTAAEMWRETVSGMPRGLAPAAAGGLDGTRDHERLYWGGAIFWLLAEMAIHQATGGKRSLRDALRAINRASGGNATDWTPEQMMRVGDGAIGGDALTKLHAAMRDKPAAIDLLALFAALGVKGSGRGVTFDDRAPLAALRHSLARA